MEVTIPTSWKDISIETYIKLRPVLTVEQESITKIINILCVLTGKKREVIKDVSLSDYHILIKKMSFVNTEIPKAVKNKRIKVGEQWYEWKLDAKNMLFGEYISVMEIMQKSTDNDEAIFDNLHKLLTTICRPIQKKYGLFWKPIKMDGEMIRKTSNNFYQNMSIADAYPVIVFFCSHYPELMKVIKTSLNERAEGLIEEVKKELTQEIALQKHGDGGH